MLFRDWGEREFHRWLLERFGPARKAGLGDDAAVIQAGPVRLAVTTDVSVEGVHFKPQWMSWREIGRRAALANISDLAAVCARPLAVWISLGVPPDMQAEAVQQAVEGVAEAAEEFSARLVGGDTTAAPVFFMDVVAAGHQQRRWTRGGAKPGDVLVVTGALGGPAAALGLLQAARTADCASWSALRERFVSPTPRVREALALATDGVDVHAAMDISDGLVLDASRLCEASGVGAEIYAAEVPLSDGVREAARILGIDAVQLAATGGEEYELLLALREHQVEKARQALARFGCPLTQVGRVVEGSGVRLVDQAGRPIPLRSAGYEHYGRRSE